MKPYDLLAVWVVAAPLLASCRSAPVHLHTLIPLGVAQARDSDRQTASLKDTVRLDIIELPREVNRKELTVRESDTTIRLLENDAWAAPLDQELREALYVNLRRALIDTPQYQAVVVPPTSVLVTVQQWEATPQQAYMEVSWRIRSGDGSAAVARRCRVQLSTSSSADVNTLVRAEQTLVTRLATAMALSLRDPDENCAH